MAQIGLHLKFEGLSGFLILLWKESSNPTAEVGRSASIAFPADQVYVINNVNPVTHIVEFWRSADGTSLSELLRTWSLQPSLIYAEVIEQFDYVVDRGEVHGTVGNGDYWADPANEDTQLIDERLKGFSKDEIRFEMRGGFKFRKDEYDLLPDGGISLLLGNAFGEPGNTYTVTVFKKIQLEQPNTGGGNEYTLRPIISSDFTAGSLDFDSSFYNKICPINFSGNVCKIVFPDFDLIANTKVKFILDGGNAKYCTLQFNTGDATTVEGQSKNVIYLTKGQMIEFTFLDNVCYVTDYNTLGRIRGDVVGGFFDKSSLGTHLKALESTGILNGNDLPGIYEYILSLDPSATVILSDWSLNKTKWGINTLTKDFRLPHLDNLHRRFITGSDSPGTYQTDQVGEYIDSAGNSEGGSDPINADTYSAGSFKMKNKKRNVGQETRVKSVKEIPLIVL